MCYVVTVHDGKGAKMADGNACDFEAAVAATFGKLGLDALSQPDKFVGSIADLYDPESPEITVLRAYRSVDLLRPFAEAASAGTTDALGMAAKRVEHYLHDVCRVLDDDSHGVAWGIARGLAAHLGVPAPHDPQKEDKNEKHLQKDWAQRVEQVKDEPEAERQRREQAQPELEGAEAREELDAKTGAEERDWLLEEWEALHGDVGKEVHKEAQPGTELEPEPGNWSLGAVIAAIACVVLVVFLVANSMGNSIDGPTDSDSVVTIEKDDNTEHTLGVNIRDDLDWYSWEELKKLSQAISAADSDEEGLEIAKEYNLVDSEGRLRGDTKTVTLADGTEAHVRILGFRHDELDRTVGPHIARVPGMEYDELADHVKAGITFEFADVPAEHGMNVEATNEGGWEASEMRAWLNSDFLELLPEDLRDCMEIAEKRTNNVGAVEAEGDASVVTETWDTLWLLSVAEVYGNLSDQTDNVSYSTATYDAEGTQYQLYADRGVNRSNYKFCKKDEDGEGSFWWLRSPDNRFAGGFGGVGLDGDWWYGMCHADYSLGVSPCFCF